jgi:hypothetical protein
MPAPPPALPPFEVALDNFGGDATPDVTCTTARIAVPVRGASAEDGAALSRILYSAAVHAISAGAAAALPEDNKGKDPAAFLPHALELFAAAISDARRTQKVGMAKAPLSLLEQAALAMPDAACTINFAKLQRSVEWPDLVAAGPAAADDADDEHEAPFTPPPTYLAHVADLVRSMVPPTATAAAPTTETTA